MLAFPADAVQCLIHGGDFNRLTGTEDRHALFANQLRGRSAAGYSRNLFRARTTSLRNSSSESPLAWASHSKARSTSGGRFKVMVMRARYQ